MIRNVQSSVAHADFWQLVEDCLVKFHHFPQATAREAAAEVRHRIETAKLPDEARDDPYARELFYHSEPFDVACEISRQKRSLADVEIREKYTEMLKRRQTGTATGRRVGISRKRTTKRTTR